MRLKQINIKNFKSLFKVEVKDLKKLNMVYGFNNSGKSNLLKFIELIFKRKSTTDKEIIYYKDGKQIKESTDGIGNFWDGIIENSEFIFYNDLRDDIIEFEVMIVFDIYEIESVGETIYNELKKHLFSATHTYFTIKINGTIESLGFDASILKLNKVFIDNKAIYTKGIDDKYFETVRDKKSILVNDGYTVFNSILNFLNDSVLLLDNNRYFEEKENINTVLQLRSSKDFNNWLFSIFLNKARFSDFLLLKQFIAKFAITKGRLGVKDCEMNSPISDFNVGFTKDEQELEVMLVNSIGKRFPLKNYGTGIQQILFILSMLYETKSKIILIEELELNLSPFYQEELIKNFLNFITDDKIGQLIFTTHSKYFKYRSDLSIYETTISSEGKTNIAKVSSVRKSFFI